MRLPILALAGTIALATFGCKKPGASADGGAEGGEGAAAGGASLAFLSGFEGEIDAFAKDNKPGAQPTPFEVFVKGNKLRFEIPEKIAAGSGAAMLGPKAYVILDSPAKKLYVVSDEKKQVIVIDLDKSGEQLKGFKGPGAPGSSGGAPEGPKTTVTKTGKYDTVAGYKCEYWDIASDHKEGTVCVAQEGASWFSIPMTGIPTEHAWAAELLDGKHFPLRFIGYQKDGSTEENRLEVTKIDKKTLPASEFEYPPSYKVVDLAQLFSGLGNMPHGGGMPPMPPFPPHPPPHHH